MPRRLPLPIVAGLCLLALSCGGGRTPISPTPPPVEPPPAEPPAPPPPTPVLAITRILAFGDSMTQGTTQPPYAFAPLTAGESWSYPYKLETLLTSRYSSQEIATLNAGKAGEKVQDSGTRSRFLDALTEAQPEVVLLMEGANDLNSVPPDGSVNATITATANVIEEMVRDAVERRHLKVMLATLPPQRAGGSRAGAASFVGKYNEALKGIAVKRNATLVDVNALFPLSLIGQDGLHPTEEGYGKMAEIFRDAIVSLYDKTPAAVSR